MRPDQDLYLWKRFVNASLIALRPLRTPFYNGVHSSLLSKSKENKRKSTLNEILNKIPKEELLFDDIMFNISSKIYYVLKSRNISITEYSRMVNVPEKELLDFSSGDVNIDIKFLSKLLSALNLKMTLELE